MWKVATRPPATGHRPLAWQVLTTRLRRLVKKPPQNTKHCTRTYSKATVGHLLKIFGNRCLQNQHVGPNIVLWPRVGARVTRKRDKFVELAEARVNRAIKDLQLIGNLSNRSAYEFTDGDVRKIFAALQKAVDTARARFSRSGDAGGGEFRL
jgi:hypothetical protein